MRRRPRCRPLGAALGPRPRDRRGVNTTDLKRLGTRRALLEIRAQAPGTEGTPRSRAAMATVSGDVSEIDLALSYIGTE